MSGNNGNGGDPVIQERWRWYGLPQVCNKLGIRPSTLFFYLNTGRIKYSLHSGKFMVRDVEVERYLRQKTENHGNAGRPRKAVLRRRQTDEQNTAVEKTM